MKKNIFMITGCAMLLAVSSIASSAEGPYVSGNVGVSMPRDSDVTFSEVPGITVEFESDSGLALGVAVGYGFATNFRVEGEVAYQKNDFDKASSFVFDRDLTLTGDTSSLAFLLNGYYDFVNTSQFTPFISAGLGLARVDINDLNVKGSGEPDDNAHDTVFAYQVGVGVGYAVHENVSIDVKYRYFGTADFDLIDDSGAKVGEFEYSSHNVYAGIRVSF